MRVEDEGDRTTLTGCVVGICHRTIFFFFFFVFFNFVVDPRFCSLLLSNFLFLPIVTVMS